MSAGAQVAHEILAPWRQAPGEPGLTGPVAQLLEVEVVRIVAGRPQIVEAADGRLVPRSRHARR